MKPVVYILLVARRFAKLDGHERRDFLRAGHRQRWKEDRGHKQEQAILERNASRHHLDNGLSAFWAAAGHSPRFPQAPHDKVF